MSSWLAEAAAVFAKDWRTELRTRFALNTLGLFAVATLVVVGLALGPIGGAPNGPSVLSAVLWLILLFAATAGLPRLFVAEEETHTATALRLAATPSALYCGKLAYGLTLLLALEAITTPLYLAMVQLPVASPGVLVATLVLGAVGLAAASTLVAVMVAQARDAVRGAALPGAGAAPGDGGGAHPPGGLGRAGQRRPVAARPV